MNPAAPSATTSGKLVEGPSVEESKALLTECGLTPEESEDVLVGCLACGKQGKAAWARGHAAIMRLARLLPEE